MTKRELLDLLRPFADEQYVYIRLHSDTYPHGCQVFIQGVDQTQPWYGNQLHTPSLIALVAHERNKEPEPQMLDATIFLRNPAEADVS